MYRVGIVALALAVAPAAAQAALPNLLAPALPFPLVVSQTIQREFVAPGIARGTYRLATPGGPIVISFVTADPREPTVRLGAVLARNRLVSNAETVSSMALRTGAVAGINADYFDIGGTNTPLGILALDGALVRTPSTRAALTVGRDRSVHIGAYRFIGTAVDNGTPIALTAVNEWPPQGGATLLTPAYGLPPAVANVNIAELVPISASGIAPGGRYRVSQIDQGTVPARPGFALALGPAAQSTLRVQPDVGDLIDIAIDTDPTLANAAVAIGGGPALLQGGVPVDDPQSPGYADRARRIPVSAAAVLADGTLAFIVVDGRHPVTSIGVNRGELIALLASMGAVDAIQFDSGGSATLVARVLGERNAATQNEPSDGVERPIADGLFLYSDAPAGPPAQLVIRPAHIVALAGATVALRASIVDAAGHPLGEAHGPWQQSGASATIDTNDELHIANAPGPTVLHVSRGGVAGDLPIDIVSSVSKITIVPDRPNPDPGARIVLHAHAFDVRGREIEFGNALRWTATHGEIDATGAFHAASVDGTATATIGAVSATAAIPVGRHATAIALFDEPHRALWHFVTTPAGGPGAQTFAGEATLQLAYDFTGTERAAYANTSMPAGDPVALSCAIDGDANGAAVRVAFIDRYGDRTALTLAKAIDWSGAQRREVRIPAALAPPLVLASIYVVGSLGPAAVRTAGTIGIRNCELSLPGSAPHAP
jgi:hypothetical protein